MHTYTYIFVFECATKLITVPDIHHAVSENNADSFYNIISVWLTSKWSGEFTGEMVNVKEARGIHRRKSHQTVNLKTLLISQKTKQKENGKQGIGELQDHERNFSLIQVCTVEFMFSYL